MGQFYVTIAMIPSWEVISLESRPSPFRDRFTHAHINGRVYRKIRRGKERASDESWVIYSDVIVFVVSLLPCRLLPCSVSKIGARYTNTNSGVARGGQKGQLPPLFRIPPPTCHTRMHARRKNTAGPRDYNRSRRDSRG